MTKQLRSTFAFATLFATQLIFVNVSFATTAEFKSDTGKISFLAVGNPSALKIQGKGEGPVGKLTVTGKSASGELTINMSSLDTGINMRTRHMKEKYLEVEKFPKANLKISKFEAKQDLSQGDYSLEKVPFEGTLTIHGIDKPVQGTADLKKTGDKVVVNANFTVDIHEYNISPEFAKITVAKDVTVDIESTATVQQ